MGLSSQQDSNSNNDMTKQESQKQYQKPRLEMLGAFKNMTHQTIFSFNVN